MASCLSTMWKVTTKPLFRRKSTCRFRKNWSADEWSRPVPMVRSAATAATTASRKSSSAAKCSVGSTGTIEVSSPSSGAASADWNQPNWNATLEPSMSWSFRMPSSKQSTRCLETKVAIRHSCSLI